MACLLRVWTPAFRLYLLDTPIFCFPSSVLVCAQGYGFHQDVSVAEDNIFHTSPQSEASFSCCCLREVKGVLQVLPLLLSSLSICFFLLESQQEVRMGWVCSGRRQQQQQQQQQQRASATGWSQIQFAQTKYQKIDIHNHLLHTRR